MIKLINDDCLKAMDKLIADGVVVDAIITDPPYNTTACHWDKLIPFNEMWLRLNKLIKPNGAIVLFGSEPFSSALRMSNIKNYKYDWIWNKKKGSNYATAKNMPLKNHEIISVFQDTINYIPQMRKGKMRNKKSYSKGGGVYGSLKSNNKDNYNDEYYPTTILEFSNANQKGKVHPTQKPVALMEYLIKTYTNEGELVLDFTCGSGSTLVGCLNTNRRGIGIELDEKYFKIAKERVESTKVQGSLF